MRNRADGFRKIFTFLAPMAIQQKKSDIDIYVVTPDNINNFLELYGKIVGDLSEKDIFFIDLLFGRESVFNIRKSENILEETVYQKGKILYEN
jgi:predicted nucleotidyltransferase